MIRPLTFFFATTVAFAAATYSYDAANRLTKVDYGNGQTITYTYDKAGNLLSRVIGSASASAAPTINPGGVVNAASYTTPLVRGELATIFGTNLAVGRASASALPLPTTLNGVQVTVGGIAAPLYFVSAMQINFQVPFEEPITGSVPVVVIQNGMPTVPQQVTMAEYAPGIFMYARTASALDPVIVHADNTLVTPDHPASANEILVIYATGVGSFDNPPATGAPASSSPIARSKVLPVVTVGGVAGQTLFAGLTPGDVGLVQINIQLPATLPPGSVLPLNVQFAGATAQAVNLYVN
jgi:uncharacterized protein (TIGR03437 family)